MTNLPELFYDKGFSNFNPRSEFLKSVVEFCHEFYKGNTEKSSAVFCGYVGNGKTHLAVSILKNLIEIPSQISATGFRKQRALFLVADEFFMTLNDASFTGKSKLALIKSWLQYDVTCLDDLGTYNITPAKIENLYTFINAAYLGKKRIIVTTNFAMKEFDKFDKRIASRLQEMAHILPFQEPDYRKTQTTN